MFALVVFLLQRLAQERRAADLLMKERDRGRMTLLFYMYVKHAVCKCVQCLTSVGFSFRSTIRHVSDHADPAGPGKPLQRPVVHAAESRWTGETQSRTEAQARSRRGSR